MKHKTRTKTLSIMLSLVLMLSLVPGMSLTAYAAPTEELLTTITATGKEQASYSTENIATVTFSYTAGGSSAYLANWGWWGYGWLATVTPADGYTITKCVFYDDANRTATDSEAPFVVETTEEDKTPRINGTPIDGGNSQSKGLKRIEVYGYATPAVEPESTYTLTIPSTLTVEKSGWNDAGGISATGTLATGKKLTVTATSANSWALKSGDNSVGYTLTTAEGGSQTTSWEFTVLSDTAATKPMGIIVENYDDKPAGTYTDTVTFTASVEDNLISFTVKRVGTSGGDFTDGTYTVAPGTTWQQFIDSGNAPACLSIGTSGIYSGKVCHDMENDVQCCGGTLIANTADNKHVKIGDAIIDGATYGCSDYLGYQDHD